MAVTFRTLRGSEIEAALDDLARLRISVFRDWPYLYDGSLDYERDYMASYIGNARAVLIAAFDGATLVGAATGSPLADHAEDFAVAFSGSDLPLERIFYCAESVLLPEYRGQGAGHAFFDGREAHARALGLGYSAFCSVIRPENHPLRPEAARSHDVFWRKRGYRPLEGVVARFAWKDVDEAEISDKSLQFWGKPL
ncbi:GNAT family N-acetyltransferase [Celeribacter halophilus]|uniref:GNAT family N-acetyltransferase n=1 Tax=Celeribacter halophilus TaxID=576117 RepID=UPI001C093AB6|nr:GNAT family N-acetyltransferase [Celeribacter halophilus]MBU2888443.1 GNAT family N-acetyltransferase [Celeribacter halophilus]MDO6509203.1 GNAT family N-acetyltransferase [Celeribacter halophilus]